MDFSDDSSSSGGDSGVSDNEFDEVVGPMGLLPLPADAIHDVHAEHAQQDIPGPAWDGMDAEDDSDVASQSSDASSDDGDPGGDIPMEDNVNDLGQGPGPPQALFEGEEEDDEEEDNSDESEEEQEAAAADMEADLEQADEDGSDSDGEQVRPCAAFCWGGGGGGGPQGVVVWGGGGGGGGVVHRVSLSGQPSRVYGVNANTVCDAWCSRFIFFCLKFAVCQFNTTCHTSVA
jgi:hypothetical protein